MASTTDICNLALFRAGSGKTIANLDTDTIQEAKLCRRLYDQCRDEVLQEMAPRFARKRLALSDTGAPPSDWAFAYAYPTDCLGVLCLVLPGIRWPRWDMRPPFEIGTDGTRTVIFTDLEQAEVIYTARVEDPTRFDPLFASALAWRMVPDLARALTGKADAGAAGEKAYQVALSKAAARSLQETWDGPEPDSEFLTVRR